MNDDFALIREYADHNSEAAFATLVSRYLNLVNSAALRQVGDPTLAAEITQTVFIILARKAGSLSSKTILPGWLYRTTNYVSAAALKIQRRRERREQEAYMQATVEGTQNDATWEQVAPLLDGAMAQLREKDRDAIVLRFFQNKSFQEVGDLLGVEQRAAQKRVARALEKLRSIFAKRGVVLTTAIIATAVSANSVQAAPTALANAVTATALAKGTISASTLTLMKGAAKIMAWTKFKTAAAFGLAALAIAGTTTLTIAEIEKSSPPSIESYFTKLSYTYLDTAPPMVLLRPSKYPGPTGYRVGLKDKALRRGVLFSQILFTAYDFAPEQMILPQDLPKGQYDLLLTTTNNPRQDLRDEIRKQFGLVAHTEMRDKDVLVLRCTNPNAPGLKVSTNGNSSSWQQGAAVFTGYKMSGLDGADVAHEIGIRAKMPVIDETGLTNSYDITFHWDATLQGDAQKENIMRGLKEQLGLELIPSRRPIEMLIVEKTKN